MIIIILSIFLPGHAAYGYSLQIVCAGRAAILLCGEGMAALGVTHIEVVDMDRGCVLARF